MRFNLKNGQNLTIEICGNWIRYKYSIHKYSQSCPFELAELMTDIDGGKYFRTQYGVYYLHEFKPL